MRDGTYALGPKGKATWEKVFARKHPVDIMEGATVKSTIVLTEAEVDRLFSRPPIVPDDEA